MQLGATNLLVYGHTFIRNKIIRYFVFFLTHSKYRSLKQEVPFQSK